jgi:hypothetical protein
MRGRGRAPFAHCVEHALVEVRDSDPELAVGPVGVHELVLYEV